MNAALNVSTSLQAQDEMKFGHDICIIVHL
jgi:hypothetical protein